MKFIMSLFERRLTFKSCFPSDIMCPSHTKPQSGQDWNFLQCNSENISSSPLIAQIFSPISSTEASALCLSWIKRTSKLVGICIGDSIRVSQMNNKLSQRYSTANISSERRKCYIFGLGLGLLNQDSFSTESGEFQPCPNHISVLIICTQ